MFGIDFSEILVIFVIALVVLGPEKLPKLAQNIGRWVGRARAMARQFREQLEQEAETLRRDTDLHIHSPRQDPVTAEHLMPDPPSAARAPNDTAPRTSRPPSPTAAQVDAVAASRLVPDAASRPLQHDTSTTAPVESHERGS